MAVLDFVLSIPFMGDAVGALIAGLVGVQIRVPAPYDGRCELAWQEVFRVTSKLGEGLVLQGLLEAQTAFPAAKQEELLDVACDRAKTP